MTMKLFFLPGTCALAVHIAAHEAGLAITPVQVNRDGGSKSVDGVDYGSINPKGKVPALSLDDGSILTETQAVLQYVSSLNPTALPIPASGIARFRFLELLNFITTDLHRTFTPMFSPLMAPEHKVAQKAALNASFAFLQTQLADKPFLFGNHYTVADSYAAVVLTWTRRHEMTLDAFPTLSAWHARILARPATQQALREEGLL